MAQKIILLLLSVSLSSGRNVISKKNSISSKRASDFFFSQSILFLSATLLLMIGNIGSFSAVSGKTVLYGLIYGALLILSQWMLTLSLKQGSTAICSVIYSLGFIFPTLSGALFFNESFTVTDGIGLFLALAVILLAAVAKGGSNEKKGLSFIPFIIIAMTASGGLGIMQKVQQTSDVASERGAFLIIAFTVALVGSVTGLAISRAELTFKPRDIAFSSVTGLCFGGANLCNTVLAGIMKSSVLFPLQNISTILLSTVLGIALFKEKFTRKTALVLGLSIVTVIIFSISKA